MEVDVQPLSVDVDANDDEITADANAPAVDFACAPADPPLSTTSSARERARSL